MACRRFGGAYDAELLHLLDQTGGVASYSHRRERGGIITLLADRGGDLYEWTGDEWDQITKGEEVRRIQ